MWPLQEFPVGELARFEYRDSENDQRGFVVGVPYGGSEPRAIDYGEWISAANHAGLVVGYDFGSKRLPVGQPLVHQSPVVRSAHARRRGPVYPEFTKLLQETIGVPIRFYVGVRIVDNPSRVGQIEVAAGGFSFEELVALREGYRRLRDGSLGDLAGLPKVDVAIDPLDDISWQPYGVRNHGILLVARRGLILRLPKALANDGSYIAYRNLLAAWVRLALDIAERRTAANLPAFTSEQTTYGRIDAIKARNAGRGVVLGAPHGSFDWYTGELVEELSYRTKLPAVIARGFTPTEGGGWRINVNRPSERRYPTDTVERKTPRASKVYEQYTAAVARVSGGPLNLYLEIHQNGEIDNIDVATAGITAGQAMQIKTIYQQLREQTLTKFPGVAKVNLVMEPVDQVVIGAWAAKDHGIFRQASSALHFELPSHLVLTQRQARSAYTAILAQLIQEMVDRRIVVAGTIPADPQL